jgi:hypothetical protein
MTKKTRWLSVISYLLLIRIASAQNATQESAQAVPQESAQEAIQNTTSESVPGPAPQTVRNIDIEFEVDLNSKAIPLPKIFSPCMDLSGRGRHAEVGWPYHLAAK